MQSWMLGYPVPSNIIVVPVQRYAEESDCFVKHQLDMVGLGWLSILWTIIAGRFSTTTSAHLVVAPKVAAH